jgi:hypothetical protein
MVAAPSQPVIRSQFTTDIKSTRTAGPAPKAPPYEVSTVSYRQMDFIFVKALDHLSN